MQNTEKSTIFAIDFVIYHDILDIKTMKKAKQILWMLTVLMMVSSCSDKKEHAKKAPVRVKTEVTQNGNVSGEQTYVGIVEESEGTAVSFTGMGVVRRVLVDEGQTVARGQLLAVMDDSQARSLLAAAEAQMSQANDALERYRMLHENGSLPEVQWVEIQSKVAQAKSQLDIARKNVSDCRLTAPVSGVIGKKLVGAGETALPSQAVVTILDVRSVKVKVSVPEAEVAGIGEHTSSKIHIDAIEENVTGGKIEKGVTADALTHTYDVRIHVANPGRRLLPGMVANVTFATTEPESSALPTLPVTAVQRRNNDSHFVWTIADDSCAHRTQVAIGQTIGNRVVITNGLANGQRVVTEGYQKLSEGTKVVF